MPEGKLKKSVDVVGAVIQDRAGLILCALRSPAMSLPGLWEFPGGKVEEGEEPAFTLQREIKEELDCEIEVFGQLEDTTHEYPGVIVRLRTYYAAITQGTPIPKEHAELRWLSREELHTIEWAPADIPAVHKLTRLT